MSAPIAGLDALPTAEAQIQALAIGMQAKELAIPVETRPNNVNLAIDLEQGQGTYTFAALPLTVAQVAGGKLEITATAYPDLA